MKLGIILETREPEKAWNALRLAAASRENRHDVIVFLMGEAVECISLIHEKYNVSGQLKEFSKTGGGILVSETCMKSHQLKASETCTLSTIADCVKMAEWADKIITF